LLNGQHLVGGLAARIGRRNSHSSSEVRR